MLKDMNKYFGENFDEARSIALDLW